MRRLTAAAGVACLVAPLLAVATVAGPVAAQPSPTAPPPQESGGIEVPDPVPGEEQCTIADYRLDQLSGLVAVDDGYIVVNDSTLFDERLPIFFLNQACEVVDQQSFAPGRPRDPEDLGLDRSTNTLWVADIGDNQAAGTEEGTPRDTVALWRVDLAGGDRTPVIHRFVYEDGQPRDAEALVIDGDGTPIIVTKAVGAAELFRPAELIPDNPPDQAVPLVLVGEFTPPDTGTENPLGTIGRRVITGGANAPDGSAVVLRTYADAFEFDVVDGDVVGAITSGEPRVTPLPGEPQGEAITYSPDGTRFLTVSEVPADQANFTPVLLSYLPTPPAPEPEPEPEPDDPAAGSAGGFSLFNSVQDIINLVAAVGVLGLLLVVAGVIGIVRSRRRWAAAAAEGTADADPDEPVTGRTMSGRSRQSGDDREPGLDQPGQPPAGGVYTASAARSGGTDYGGDQYGGGQYAAGGYAGGEHDPEQYQGNEYGGSGYGDYPPTAHRGDEYGYAPQYEGGSYDGAAYPGGEYGGSYPRSEYGGEYEYDQGGQPDQRGPHYDQEWSGGAGYVEPGYAPPAGYTEPQPDAGPHSGGGYQPNQPDYYSDDPDYPYEFREPGRW